MMKTSPQGIAALVIHEGIVLAPYRDSQGVWTYGIGHTAAAGEPDPSKMKRGTPDDAGAELTRVFQVFAKDLKKYEAEVRRAIEVPLEQHEFDAAVSFHFNTGAIGRATWVKCVNDGDFKQAVDTFMNWSKPPEIIPRREAELALFAHGKYPDGPATVWDADMAGQVLWNRPKNLSFEKILHFVKEAGRKPPRQTLLSLILNLLSRLFGGKK